jgi:hypothetical protein
MVDVQRRERGERKRQRSRKRETKIKREDLMEIRGNSWNSRCSVVEYRLEYYLPADVRV